MKHKKIQGGAGGGVIQGMALSRKEGEEGAEAAELMEESLAQTESRRSGATLKVPEAATEPQRRPPEMESGYRRAKVELVRLRAEADPEGVWSQTEPWGGRLESSGWPASPWHC